MAKLKDNILEIGVIFRGFVLFKHSFEKLDKHKEKDSKKTLRGAFIEAMNKFAQKCFSQNSNLEYLESGDVLFIFKYATVDPSDSNGEEDVIFYGLVKRKKQRYTEKFVEEFLEIAEEVLEKFVEKYDGVDFTELDQFQSFKYDAIGYFV
ncbi:MAG: hypothetical protein ACOC44_03595 [Promethearchaeia archaeon]